MNARELHYDFKQKLNKLDSQKNRNLLVPEIDWKLNEAQEVLIKVVAFPRLRSQLGFELNQRVIDDIRTVVVNQKKEEGIVPTQYDNSSFLSVLPPGYKYFVNANVYATKGKCTEVKLRTKEIQHDDEAESSEFDKSSFEWRLSNIRFFKDGLRIFTDGTYVIDKICFDYVKQPAWVHNAQDYEGGTYTGLDGVVYTGSQTSELPASVHRELVDLAVLITAGDLDMANFQLKKFKTDLTQ